MGANLPPPMVPADCDLRDFPRMAVDIPRLFASGFNGTASRNPLAWMIGHKLWYRSWHQVPAGSLPSDPDELCHLAELGFDRKSFDRVRAIAMRGWIECSDGRLYHRMVSETALEAWFEKLRQRLASGNGNEKRWGVRFDPEPINKNLSELIVCLERLNPQSRSILKARRSLAAGTQQSSGDDPGGTDGDPGGIDPPSQWDEFPGGKPSQEKGKGKGIIEEEAKASLSPGKPDDVRRAFDEWNGLARKVGLPVAKDLTDERRKKLRARLATSGLDGWREALRAVEVSKHCRGLKPGREGGAPWRANLDFLLRPSSFQKLVEGNFGSELKPVVSGPAMAAPRFPGPARVREAFVKHSGEAFTAAWVDLCGWQDVPEAALTCARETVLDRIRRDCFPVLQALELNLLRVAAVAA